MVVQHIAPYVERRARPIDARRRLRELMLQRLQLAVADRQ